MATQHIELNDRQVLKQEDSALTFQACLRKNFFRRRKMVPGWHGSSCKLCLGKSAIHDVPGATGHVTPFFISLINRLLPSNLK